MSLPHSTDGAAVMRQDDPGLGAVVSELNLPQL